MRAPRALLTLLTISACNGSNDGGSVSVAAQTSEGATTEATGTGLATTPTTTTAEPPTTTEVSDGTSGAQSSTSSTGPDATGSTGAAQTGTTGDETSTTGGETSTTGGETVGETSTGAVSDTGGSSTGPGCPEGQDGCPCGDGCDPGLACELGVCGPAPKCGDGKVDPGEACDDGANNGDSQACTSQCSKQVCGDGFLGANEQCDDGNQVDGDGCQKTCVKTPVPAKDACGFDSDGVWFQIDYSNANTVSNPTYTYSPTPGWGEAQWAPAGKSWPYAVDLFNNAAVVNDQIGKVALLDGTNKAVRVYFGLVGLSYDYATVCVEGRSYSVGSSVQFFVMEAKSKCGDYGSMANDWSVHATGVDLQDCFLPGDGFQGVQVQPSGGSGSLSLKRLRVTLHGANY